MNLFVKTDAAFHKEFPELKGRSLTNSPSDKSYRDEYVKILKVNKKNNAAKSKKANNAKQSCPAATEKKETKKSITCKADSIEIIKGGNSYVLSVPGTNLQFKRKNLKNISTFEMVSGPETKPIELTINAKGIAGPCPDNHQNKTFNFAKHDLKLISKSDNIFKANVFSGTISAGNSISALHDAFAIFFNGSSKHVLKYPISFNTCGLKESTVVSVFPDLAFNAAIGINIEWKYSKNNLKGEKLVRNEEEAGPLQSRLQYSIDLKHSGISLVEIKQKTEKDPDKPAIITFLETIEENLEFIEKGFGCFFSDSQKLTVNIKPSIEGSIKLKEIPNTPFVGTEFSITVGFSPLLGINAEADVSGKLLMAVPAIGIFIAALEKIDLADVFLGFIISGELGLNSTFSKFAEKDELEDNKVKFTGAVKIKLQGHVKSSYQIWSFKYSVGAKIGAQSGFEIEETMMDYDAKGVYIPLKIKFLGIICYKQMWANCGISSESDAVPKFTKTSDFSAVGSKEEDDTENMQQDKKLTIVNPSVLYDDKFYLTS